ncbi:MAG TPA: YIEGIA family protein [Syntrophomonadaceae bacterium]|nr:YIEGIA family protein [Syntrophomonadaceae bacterium]
MQHYLLAIILGIVAGFSDRWLMLRNDYRHYPTYPHGHLTHLALGFIASGLGAVAVPAIAKPDYVAVTFLALAAQQFRDIRNMERETLNNLEKTKLIPRGSDYIEGIARVFEARNYLTILTALVTSGFVYWKSWPYAIAAALIMIWFSLFLMKGSSLGEIAEVEIGQIHFQGSILKVNDVMMMNVGLAQTRDKIQQEGMGFIIRPKNDNARLSLDAPGQRMAIVHDLVSVLGSKVDMEEGELHPMVRKNIDQGYLALFIVANEPDRDYAMQIIKKVPVLESSRGTTLNTYYGRKAAD